MAAALQIDINALFSRSSGETLLKANVLDHEKITKFEILLVVASFLMILAGVFSIGVHSWKGKISEDALTAVKIAFGIVAIGGLTLNIVSSIWFRDFYKGKFFTEQYRLIDYRFDAFWELSTCFLTMSYLISAFLSGSFSIWIIILSDLAPALFLGLALLGAKETHMKIEKGPGHIALLAVGLFLTLIGGIGWLIHVVFINGVGVIANGWDPLALTLYGVLESLGAALLSWFALSAKPRPDNK